MPAIIFLLIFIAWKCFFVSSAYTDNSKDAGGCGCLLFFIIGGMFLLSILLNM